jgi:hypothetical protein
MHCWKNKNYNKLSYPDAQLPSELGKIVGLTFLFFRKHCFEELLYDHP